MVHGTFYGIQYEIHLTKELDFYDDLLPIWIELRAQIHPEKERQTGNNKLIVIPYGEFAQQLYNNKLFTSYIRENDGYRYDRKKNINEEEYLRSQKFVMVYLYEKYIKRMTSLPEPISKEEFTKLAKEKHKLDNLWRININMSSEQWEERTQKLNEITEQIKVQRFIHDQEYFQEIKNLHKQLLEQVCFTEEQNALIKKLITHSKLTDIISWHGLTLVDGHW